MKELSIFVDESGDFGAYTQHAPYYIITMVFHDQSNDISSDIIKLNKALRQIGYGDEQAVHTEPLIRREHPYQYFQPNERRAIFSKLYYFTLNCEIKYKSFVFRKAECGKLSNSEERIFHSVRDLKKDFLRGIHKKEF